MDHGLKSKVAKTRQGSLEEIGVMLKRVGLSVCDPGKTFPVIASMIGDKDPNVRKAALGALRYVYVRWYNIISSSIPVMHMLMLANESGNMLDPSLRRTTHSWKSASSVQQDHQSRLRRCERTDQ